MVKGQAALRAKFNRVPEMVKTEIMAAMEKSANELVADMNALKPLPEITIDWTWGDIPAGALKIGTFKGAEYGRMAIKVYATASKSRVGDFPAIAAWFEFGTAERFHKSGKSVGRITAQPYFFPAFRSNKTRIKGRLTRALKKGLAKV